MPRNVKKKLQKEIARRRNIQLLQNLKEMAEVIYDAGYEVKYKVGEQINEYFQDFLRELFTKKESEVVNFIKESFFDIEDNSVEKIYQQFHKIKLQGFDYQKLYDFYEQNKDQFKGSIIPDIMVSDKELALDKQRKVYLGLQQTIEGRNIGFDSTKMPEFMAMILEFKPMTRGVDIDRSVREFFDKNNLLARDGSPRYVKSDIGAIMNFLRDNWRDLTYSRNSFEEYKKKVIDNVEEPKHVANNNAVQYFFNAMMTGVILHSLPAVGAAPIGRRDDIPCYPLIPGDRGRPCNPDLPTTTSGAVAVSPSKPTIAVVSSSSKLVTDATLSPATLSPLPTINATISADELGGKGDFCAENPGACAAIVAAVLLAATIITAYCCRRRSEPDPVPEPGAAVQVVDPENQMTQVSEV